MDYQNAHWLFLEVDKNKNSSRMSDLSVQSESVMIQRCPNKIVVWPQRLFGSLSLFVYVQRRLSKCIGCCIGRYYFFFFDRKRAAAAAASSPDDHRKSFGAELIGLQRCDFSYIGGRKYNVQLSVRFFFFPKRTFNVIATRWGVHLALYICATIGVAIIVL